MAIKSFTRSTIENNIFYRSMLAGNSAFSPTDYYLLETQTLASSAASVTFTGLGSYTDYKHLQFRFVARDSASYNDRAVDVRVNGDSGTNYSSHRLFGNGSAVSSNGYTNQTLLNNIGSIPGNTAVTGDFGAGILDVLDAFDTSKNSTFKMLSGHAGSSNLIHFDSGLYINTSALTSIEFIPSSNYLAGSRFSLYGIKGA